MRTTRRSSVAALVLTAGLMLVACASPAGKAGQGMTLVRQLDDAGKPTVLHRGDHLLLDLGTGRVSAFLKFTLTGYPGSQLRLLSIDPANGRFEFQAVATGSGSVRVEGNFRCGGPLPAGAPAMRCPVAGDEAPFVNRQFVFPVQVR